jgi:hypothetical protein
MQRRLKRLGTTVEHAAPTKQQKLWCSAAISSWPQRCLRARSARCGSAGWPSHDAASSQQRKRWHSVAESVARYWGAAEARCSPRLHPRQTMHSGHQRMCPCWTWSLCKKEQCELRHVAACEQHCMRSKMSGQAHKQHVNDQTRPWATLQQVCDEWGKHCPCTSLANAPRRRGSPRSCGKYTTPVCRWWGGSRRPTSQTINEQSTLWGLVAQGLSSWPC